MAASRAEEEELLRKLCGDGLELYLEIARSAVEDEAGDPWDVFTTFMRRIVEADTHTLTINLAGSFTPTARERRNAALAEELNDRLVARAQAAGVLREDVDPHDLSHVFEQIARVRGSTPERTAELRARYLALHLDGLRAPARTPLPGPAPTSSEQRARWQRRDSTWNGAHRSRYRYRTSSPPKGSPWPTPPSSNRSVSRSRSPSSTISRTASHVPAGPMSWTAPAGPTAFRSTTSASSSTTGRDGYDWRAHEARLNAHAAVRHDYRRPASPLPARALAGARRTAADLSPTDGRCRCSSTSI